ncbi:MAG: metallophosphoesterase [Cytophagales bacterium]|nr:metallophosphoesterase [Bernardetiaceae bacterium]MDW8205774.1 metallophosphoesterase [Cytophagales bacterium]
MSKVIFFLLIATILLAIDWYVFQAVRVVWEDSQAQARRLIYGIYWALSLLTISILAIYPYLPASATMLKARRFVMVWGFMFYFSKLFAILFIAIDDLLRLVQWVHVKLSTWLPRETPSTLPAEKATETLLPTTSETISRSAFLMQAGLVAAAVPLASMTFGIISGAHDYRIRRVRIALRNLPKAFDGIRIGQLSDIHAGSFFNRVAVQGGVEMLLKEKPDVVFFTGDLVNDSADEMRDYFSVFKRVTAPMGVYSVLGNHDYGDYRQWSSPQAKYQNLQTLKQIHAAMGWRLLMNEHIYLQTAGEKIAVIGVENWGAKGNFPKYGKLHRAYAGTEQAPVKLLLSHDPSHWDAQVRPHYPDIDLMLAGHTHGMQFGIEIGSFKWSPVQYFYQQWAGLYQQQHQYLYVNRGFGYIGFPGRIGILPEITIIELTRA